MSLHPGIAFSVLGSLDDDYDVPPKKESNYNVSLEGQKGGQTVSVLTSRRLVFVLGPLDWSQKRILLPNCTDHRFVT